MVTPRYDNMGKSLGSMNLNFAWVDGDSATTNIPVTDITTDDEILTAVEFDISPSNDQSPVPITDLSITSDGNVQTAATNTTGSTLMIVWIKKNV